METAERTSMSAVQNFEHETSIFDRKKKKKCHNP